jgi:ornithine cyclodeaminase/alanine dehydrogenase-like protein (mu-crystallin family)
VTLLLRHAEVEGLLSLDEVIAAVRAGLEEQAQGQAQVPPRTTIDSASGHGWLRVMPVILNGSGLMGFKAMHATPGVGVRYLVACYELSSGALLALIDANWLTQARTASTAAIGTDALARHDARRVAVIGSSAQASMLLAAVARVRPFKQVRVFSPTPANRERFATRVREEYGVEAHAVGSGAAAVEDADLLLSAIRATQTPVVLADWLRPGLHVTAISSVRPEARELDAAIWTRADGAGVDDREHVFDSGDGRAALASGGFQPGDAAELWELLSGKRPCRQDPQQITLFKSVGTGLQDLAVAGALYRRARERGVGQDLGDVLHIQPPR